MAACAAAPKASPAGHWTFTPRAVFTDSIGPGIALQPAVFSTSVDRTVTVNWTANEPAVGFTCSVDLGAFTPLANAATTTFRIIDTALVSGPAGFSNVNQRGQDPHGPRVQEAADHDQVPAAGREVPGGLLAADDESPGVTGALA